MQWNAPVKTMRRGTRRPTDGEDEIEPQGAAFDSRILTQIQLDPIGGMRGPWGDVLEIIEANDGRSTSAGHERNP